MKVYVSIGSNSGCAHKYFNAALCALSEKVGRICAVSRIYRSPAMYVKDQKMFSNAVVLLDTTLQPFILLRTLQEIEKASGRVRTINKGPRTLDLDIVFYGIRRIRPLNLQVPHPLWQERPFVILPLWDVIYRHPQERWKLDYFNITPLRKTLRRYSLATTRAQHTSTRYPRWTAQAGYGKRKCCCGSEKGFCP